MHQAADRPSAELRRARERYRSTPAEGVESRHAFSFSGHYDPDNTHFGALVACNEESLDPGAGFDDHRHRDIEILTWVLAGSLDHRDGDGHAAVVHRGTVQHLSAGSGVTHSERNAGDGPTRFVQMWLLPDVHGTDPSYGLRQVEPSAGGLTLLASGQPRDAGGGALALRRSDAALYLVTAAPGQPLPALPEAAFRYAHLTAGSLGFRTVPGPKGTSRSMEPGDSVRITGDAFADPVAGPDGVELLLWEMHSTMHSARPVGA